jgi:hypothetical protein
MEKSTTSGACMVTSRLHVQNVRTEINHALHAQLEFDLASVTSQVSGDGGQGTLTSRSINKGSYQVKV